MDSLLLGPDMLGERDGESVPLLACRRPNSTHVLAAAPGTAVVAVQQLTHIVANGVDTYATLQYQHDMIGVPKA